MGVSTRCGNETVAAPACTAAPSGTLLRASRGGTAEERASLLQCELLK